MQLRSRRHDVHRNASPCQIGVEFTEHSKIFEENRLTKRLAHDRPNPLEQSNESPQRSHDARKQAMQPLAANGMNQCEKGRRVKTPSFREGIL